MAKIEDPGLDAWIDGLTDREDFLFSNVPSCPECRSKQVQIMDKTPPASWRCRICRYPFVFEPKS